MAASEKGHYSSLDYLAENRIGSITSKGSRGEEERFGIESPIDRAQPFLVSAEFLHNSTEGGLDSVANAIQKARANSAVNIPAGIIRKRSDEVSGTRSEDESRYSCIDTTRYSGRRMLMLFPF